MTTRNERLEQFFGGYFHQDWDIQGATSWRDVIKQYSVDATRAQVLAIRTDLQDWLNENANEENENLRVSPNSDELGRTRIRRRCVLTSDPSLVRFVLE